MFISSETDILEWKYIRTLISLLIFHYFFFTQIVVSILICYL